MTFGHGMYSKAPENLYIFFVSKASRMLPQSVVTPEFVEFLTSERRVTMYQSSHFVNNQIELPRRGA